MAASLWFTSDQHLFHDKVIKRQNRPFASLNEMHDVIIDRWNTNIAPTDTVYVLGDFAYANNTTPTELLDVFKTLNGTKHLVVGNHDEQHRGVLRLPWESIGHYAAIKTGNPNHRWVTACHYAMETWRGMSTGSLMLHGHSHGTLKRPIPYRFDVGVDVWDFTPVHIDRLCLTASRQVFEPQDMHGEYDYAAYE
jgi:calcineurin-like phosphoesterase family protein